MSSGISKAMSKLSILFPAKFRILKLKYCSVLLHCTEPSLLLKAKHRSSVFLHFCCVIVKWLLADFFPCTICRFGSLLQTVIPSTIPPVCSIGGLL